MTLFALWVAAFTWTLAHPSPLPRWPQTLSSLLISASAGDLPNATGGLLGRYDNCISEVYGRKFGAPVVASSSRGAIWGLCLAQCVSRTRIMEQAVSCISVYPSPMPGDVGEMMEGWRGGGMMGGEEPEKRNRRGRGGKGTAGGEGLGGKEDKKG